MEDCSQLICPSTFWHHVIVPSKLLNQVDPLGAEVKRKILYSQHDIINSRAASASALLCVQHWSSLHLTAPFSGEISVI